MTMVSTLTGQRVEDARCLPLGVSCDTHGVTWAVAERHLNRTNAPSLRAFLETRCALPERPVRIDFSGVLFRDAACLRLPRRPTRQTSRTDRSQPAGTPERARRQPSFIDAPTEE